MRRTLVFLVVFLLLVVPARVLAKADLYRITIRGGNLKNPIEITDQKTLGNFDVWTGPGTGWTAGSPKERDRFIIDWTQTAATDGPKGLQRYEILFYAKMPNEHLVHVLFYEYDAAAGHGYTYLPGRTDNGSGSTWARFSMAWKESGFAQEVSGTVWRGRSLPALK
ncbi:MAG: hypothetical protein JWO91_3126 [Acidobacteriaceae bacterium]|nr:hypothetical protein [Acidobacteriaceae bacterium]